MKKYVLVIVLFTVVFFSIEAQESYVDSLFKSANKAYSEQDYLQSIDLYSSIIDTGYKSPELYLNLGNSYFKNSDYIKAILYFEKASLLDPRNEDIMFNLAKAQAYTIDRIEVIPEFFLVTWGRKVISIFSSNTWALLALFCLVISLVLFVFYFMQADRGRKVAFFSIGLIIVVITVLSFVFSVKTKNYIENSDQAIIMESTVTIKGSPDINGINVFIIHEGAKVFLLRSIGEWYEIKLSDGKQGWLQSSDFVRI